MWGRNEEQMHQRELKTDEMKQQERAEGTRRLHEDGGALGRSEVETEE